MRRNRGESADRGGGMLGAKGGGGVGREQSVNGGLDASTRARVRQRQRPDVPLPSRVNGGIEGQNGWDVVCCGGCGQGMESKGKDATSLNMACIVAMFSRS